jgi:UDP-N-acetylglucosamine 2-epimerase
MSFKILSVLGARPNFMKVAAICEAIKWMNSLGAAEQIHHILVHTGQHYDHNMSDSFFNDLELPKPDLCLGAGSASHSVQTTRIWSGLKVWF